MLSLSYRSSAVALILGCAISLHAQTFQGGVRGIVADHTGATIVVLANSDLADKVEVAHPASILADSRVIGIARVHTVCFSNTSGIAA